MILCNSTEYASLAGVTLTPAQTATVNTLIPVVQDQIETYLDRLLDAQTYYEWYDYGKVIMLEQYPVNQVKLIAAVKEVAYFSSDNYTYEIKCSNTTGIPQYLYITDGTLTTTTITFGGAITTLTDIKTAVEAAIPAITLTINSGYTLLNYKLLRKGTSKKLYGAERIDCLTKVEDNRSLTFLADAEFFFYSTIDLGTSVIVYIVYNAGFSCTDMPYPIKMVAVNTIKDIMNISSAGLTGLYQSETITNYSYTLGANVTAYVHQELSKYYGDLDPFRKKTV